MPLFQLFKEDEIEYIYLGENQHNIFKKFIAIPTIIKKYIKRILKYRPTLIISKASPYAVLISKVFKIKTIITPDSEVVLLTQKFVAPLATRTITPVCFNKSLGHKHTKISALFENCYLDPKVFSPSMTILDKYGINIKNKYTIVRFVGWSANHDLGKRGFSNDEKVRLIFELSKLSDIYISTEIELPVQLEKYILKCKSKDIHSILHYANLYIGDSQSMATEAALLGTPSLRYNSFVGNNDMSNFIFLQNKYEMLFNFNVQQFDQLVIKGKEILNDINRKEIG